MIERKIGLVLDGGGGKGAYQIGVWKAMKEFGYDKQVAAVSGTSVGGLNAALFVQGNYKKAYDIWTKEISKIHPLTIQMDLSKLIDEHIDFQAIRKSKIDCFLSAHSGTQSGEYCELTPDEKSVVRYVNGKMAYYNLRVLSEQDCRIVFDLCSTSKAVLLATSALPILCPQVWIKNHYYKDGGCGDNCPVYPLTWRNHECDTILAIHLDPFKTAGKEEHPGVRILEIVPSVPSDKMGLLTGTLNFTSEHAKELINYGYEDAKRLFEQIRKNDELSKMEQQPIDRRKGLKDQREGLNLTIEKHKQES